jgi:galactose mutarotase-like enzyme
MSYQTYQHNRNYGCRIREYIYEGYRCVALENQKLRVSILADKGADIYEFLYKPCDVDFMWRSWVGLRPWSHRSPTTPRPSGPHMDYYEGGWQELFPNCGAMSLHQGAEIGQHGEVLLLPWSYSITKDEPDEVEVQFEVRTIRTPFHLVRRMALRGAEGVLYLNERATNEGGQAVDFTWGHHPALGWPFLEEGCRVDLPECRIIAPAEFTPQNSRLKPDQNQAWPLATAADGATVDLSRIPGPDAACQDMVFLDGITDGWYAVTNPKKKLGFGIRYPANIFKVLWYWQVYRGGIDYPWWGATYNIALEPCATMPVLSQSAVRGEALSLEPGESLEAELLAVAYDGLESVSRVSETGKITGS